MAVVDLLVVGLFVVIAILVIQRRQTGRATADDRIAEHQRLRDEVDHLKARIQVLERVITDTHGSTDLSSEIDRLRDR